MLLIGANGSRKMIRLEEGEKFPHEKLKELCGSKKTREISVEVDIKTYGKLGRVLIENEFSAFMMYDNFNAFATTLARDSNGKSDNSDIMFFGDVVLMSLWELDHKSIDVLKENMKQNREGASRLMDNNDRQMTLDFWRENG